MYTPKLFFAWADWAKKYESPKDNIRPFGEQIGPDWMETDFESLEYFYNYYTEITEGNK